MNVTASGRPHLSFLDGTRGLAALYVVLHHVWLTAYPLQPTHASCELCRDAPAWTTVFAWGQLAVAVFIVVSGFSLALAPMRSGERLGGFGPYIARRALRIVPPYWAALALSCGVIVAFTGAHSGNVVTAKSVVVHAMLVQNVIDTPKPNGAFWSIAVEWQIYFVFPLLLLVLRRFGATVMATATLLAVLAAYFAGTHAHLLAVSLGMDPAVLAPLGKLLYLRPHFLALFALGVVAAHALSAQSRWTRLPWLALGAALTLVTVAVLLLMPMRAVERNWFWLDLLAGGTVAVLFAALAQRPSVPLSRLLGCAALRWLGQSSYSLYLIHVPVLELTYYLLIQPRVEAPDARFACLLVLVVPASIGLSRLFWHWIERPFMDRAAIAGWASTAGRLIDRLRTGLRRPDPETPGAG